MVLDIPLIDAHLHPVRLPTVPPAWREWAQRYGKGVPLFALYRTDGTLDPARFDRYLDEEGVDGVILLCEYSPRTVGIQPYEDLLPILRHNPRRFRFLANVNPHLHYPALDHLAPQLAAGAVGVKIHPVHGGFPVDHPDLFPVYAVCEERGLPVVVHTGTSTFPGAINAYGDPAGVETLLRVFPRLTVVLAHGGRGWWYDHAAFLASTNPRVWIELSGLPPARLPRFYARWDLEKLARKFIFGTDWPGVPGIRANAEALAQLGWDRATLEGVFYRNALAVYRWEDWVPPS